MKNFSKPQKEGVARILDGFVVAASIALSTYIFGHVDMKEWEALLLFVVDMICLFCGLYLRKD